MPYLHYNYSLMQALLKSKESQCMDCTRELGEDSAEVPGITTRHNLIEAEKLFVSDLTNIVPTAIKKIPQQFPYVVEIAETKYILHGKVYSTEPSGVHFYTVSKIPFNGTTFLANLDSLNGNNLQVLDTKRKQL